MTLLQHCIWSPFVILAILYTLLVSVNGKTLEVRGLLINSLFKNYDKWNYPDNVTVQIGLSLISMTSKQYDNHPFTANVILRQVWNDQRLQWDPSEYGGQSNLSIPSEEVWKPDIRLLNTIKAPSKSSCAVTKLSVSSNGQVYWITPCQFETSCYQSPGNYNAPKDCVLKFGTWASDGTIKDLQFYNNQPQVDLGMLEDASEGNVTGSRAERVEKLNNDLFPTTLNFHVVFQQKQQSYSPSDPPAPPLFSPASIGLSPITICNPEAKVGSDGTCQEVAKF